MVKRVKYFGLSLIIFIVLLLFIPLVVDADEITQPVEKESVYTNSKLYELKVKLQPKIVESEEIPSLNKKIDFTLVPIVKIDEKIFRLCDFKGIENIENLKDGKVIFKRIELNKGEHKYEKLENDIFDIDWVILEPVHSLQPIICTQEPEIVFKKINPTKYLVKVEGAKEPFWLVFSESFRKDWRLYRMPNIDRKMSEFTEIVADYPKLGVKEARHLMKFTPEDIRYLFRKPLDASHQLVNGYANGWNIEPKKLGLGDNFILVIYFWPQTLFYLGLFISGFTLIGCVTYIGHSFYKNKRNNRRT